MTVKLPKNRAKSLADSVEVVEGLASGDIKRPSKFMKWDKKANEAVFKALNHKIRLSSKILSIWSDILDNPPQEQVKWSDFIRVTELAAKHAGLLDEQSRPLTVNHTSIDIRNTDEKELLRLLEQYDAKRTLETTPLSAETAQALEPGGQGPEGHPPEGGA